MPRLYDEPENADAIEPTSTANLPQSPAGSQISSASRFASLVRSPVPPANESARSSTRSSLARQLNGVGEETKSAGKDSGELSPASSGPRQSSRIRSASAQTKPAQKAPPPAKRELRPKGKVVAKGAVRKVGRPAKAATAQRRGRPAKKATESKARETKATANAREKRNEWEVEKIVDSRIEEETLQHFFRVKWKGFSDKDNTWEPKKNLANCKSLVEAYEKKAGK
ncbi:hypothetical protein V8C42DRAFT_324578 [Trichoderma barbatum]